LKTTSENSDAERDLVERSWFEELVGAGVQVVDRLVLVTGCTPFDHEQDRCRMLRVQERDRLASHGGQHRDVAFDGWSDGEVETWAEPRRDLRDDRRQGLTDVHSDRSGGVDRVTSVVAIIDSANSREGVEHGHRSSRSSERRGGQQDALCLYADNAAPIGERTPDPSEGEVDRFGIRVGRDRVRRIVRGESGGECDGHCIPHCSRGLKCHDRHGPTLRRGGKASVTAA
jgi:hypothetical protein